MEGLFSFEVVLRVDCNQIFSSDIILFYEKTFPIASTAFPKKGSLKKSFDEFKVLWIMDGFDECTTEFKGFLTAMKNSLSEKHRILITTRPNKYKDLKGYLGELSMTSFTLELFQDRNVEEIIQILITEDEKKQTFKTHMSFLDGTAKDLLRTPLNLNLYIKLWKQDPELVTNTFTTKMLLLKTIDHNLTLLPKRLDGHTSLALEELKDSVKDWFFGSLCKQSFLMLMHKRFNFISKEDQDTLKKDARKFTQDTSMCLSTFLAQVKNYDWKHKGESKKDDDGEEWENEEEDKGESRYKFHHLTQQEILASLFLKHFKDYDGENVINSICSRRALYNLKFYVEMMIKDCSLDNDLTQVFSPIQYILNCTNDDGSKIDFLFRTSVALNFNEKFMEKVSQAFKDIPGLACGFNSLVSIDVKKFLEFVRPQNIILCFSFKWLKENDLLPLLEFLIKSQLEIEFRGRSYNYSSVGSSDKAYCGSFAKFLKHRKLGKFKTICIQVNYSSQFKKKYFRSVTFESNALERLEIWINLDDYFVPSNIIKKPTKSLIEITTIGLTGLNKENFGTILEVLNKMKVEETLKFKVLHHDFEDISEKDKRHLQKMAHTVSIDFICQCKKDIISKIGKLNITSIEGNIQWLNALNAHHGNLKSVFLDICNKGEFYRTLKFLRDYKANLDEVNLMLFDSFPELVNPKIRTSSNDFSKFINWLRTFFGENSISANVFTIPQELVQRTTIYIPKINEDSLHNYFTLLNNLRGDKTLKFKAVYADRRYLKHDHLEMLKQVTLSLKLSMHADHRYLKHDHLEMLKQVTLSCSCYYE